MKKISILFFVVFLAAAGGLYPQINRTVYDNGFTLIHSQRKGCGLVSAVLFVKGGSFDESGDKAGITNLASNLLQKGTLTRDAAKIALDSELLGASIGAGSSSDYTEVSMIVPSENFSPAFAVFCDIVNNPTFPETEFEKEKESIIAAIRSKNDSIFNTAYDYFNETIYDGNPYHRPSIGYEATVSSLTVADIIDNYKRNFRPENMVLSVVGDIGAQEINNAVTAAFGKMKVLGRAADVKKDTAFGEVKRSSSPVAQLPAKKIFTGKFQQSYYFCGFPAPDVKSGDYPALKMVNEIAGGGMGGRLFNDLREKNGLVYEADSFFPSRVSTSTFAVYAGTSKENVDKVEGIITAEIAKLPSATQQELDAAREYLKGTYLIDHRTIQKQAWYLGWWETMGRGFEYDSGYVGDIDGVKLQDIGAACEKYLTPDKMAAVILK